MPDALWGILPVTAGSVLGVLFYGGLWWTVRHAADFRRPALTVLGSTLLRTAAVLSGFYAVAGGEWSRMVLCLLGFQLARLAVTWVTRLPSPSPSPFPSPSPSAPAETRHAP